MGGSTFLNSGKKGYLSDIKELIEQGKVKTFVEKVYSVEHIVEAVEYIVKNHAQGKIAVRINFNKL